MTNNFLSCNEDDFEKEQNEIIDLNNITDNNIISIDVPLEVDSLDCSPLDSIIISCQNSGIASGIHNELDGIQGGTTTQKYHISKLQWDAIAASNQPSETNPFLTLADGATVTWESLENKPNSGEFIYASPSTPQDENIKLQHTSDRYLEYNGQGIVLRNSNGSTSGSSILLGNNTLNFSGSTEFDSSITVSGSVTTRKLDTRGIDSRGFIFTDIDENQLPGQGGTQTSIAFISDGYRFDLRYQPGNSSSVDRIRARTPNLQEELAYVSDIANYSGFVKLNPSSPQSGNISITQGITFGGSDGLSSINLMNLTATNNGAFSFKSGTVERFFLGGNQGGFHASIAGSLNVGTVNGNTDTGYRLNVVGWARAEKFYISETPTALNEYSQMLLRNATTGEVGRVNLSTLLGDFVDKSNNQTIGGIKRFSKPITVINAAESQQSVIIGHGSVNVATLAGTTGGMGIYATLISYSNSEHSTRLNFSNPTSTADITFRNLTGTVALLSDITTSGSDPLKANLAGGNFFTGNQIIGTEPTSTFISEQIVSVQNTNVSNTSMTSTGVTVQLAASPHKTKLVNNGLEFTYNDTASIRLLSGATSGGTKTLTLPAKDGTVATLDDILALDSGTYTPIVVFGTNVTSLTLSIAHYIRVGNEVTVTANFSTLTSSSGVVDFYVSLPIISTLSANDLVGTGATAHGTTALGFWIQPSNNTAWVSTASAAITNQKGSFTFTYIIK